MSNVKLLLSFNIIIIFLSYYFNKYTIIIYPFVFIFLITMFLQLHYKKNIEGFIDDNERSEEIFSVWDNLGQDTYEESNNYLLDKINQLLKVLIGVEKKFEEKYYDEKCEGEFVVDKAKKDCGYNVYDEKTYKITKQGYDCDHRAGHKERTFKPLCRLGEKCRKDRDCSRGKCANGECKIDFECDSNKLNNCDKDGCDKLNDKLGFDKYKFIDGKCRINSCNEEQYYNCDENGCEGLGYKFKWDENQKSCIRKDLEVTKCSQVTCPSYYSLNENGKDYNCKRKLSRGELENRLSDRDIELNDEDEGFISECNSKNCCKENYTCKRYFTGKGDICECEDGECNDNCFYGNELYSANIFENGIEKTIYYNYKEKIPEGKNINDITCKGFDCTGQECLGENVCYCDNGTPPDICPKDGGHMCESCDEDNNFELKDGKCVCDKDNNFELKDGKCVCDEDNNFELKDGKCVCDEENNFVLKDGKCVCDKVNNFELKDDKCVCKEGYHSDNDECVKTIKYRCNCKEGKCEVREPSDDSFGGTFNSEEVCKSGTGGCRKCRQIENNSQIGCAFARNCDEAYIWYGTPWNGEFVPCIHNNGICRMGGQTCNNGENLSKEKDTTMEDGGWCYLD